jgi:hypothetical protein
MRNTIETIVADPDALRQAVRQADRLMSARAGDPSAPPVYLDGKVSDSSRPLVFHGLKNSPFQSEVTGRTVNRYLAEPDDLDTAIHDRIDTVTEVQMPLGYLVPAAWTTVVDLLQLHGVEMEKTVQPLEREFETYRFDNIKFAASSNEGHVAVSFDARPVKEMMRIPAGSYWVPLRQRRGRLALAMLEPQAPDSLARWGLMNPVFETGFGSGAGEYLSEPIARRMMAGDAGLRRQFEARLAADAPFAADARARLQWWLDQSRYQPGDTGRYPIARVWEKTW